MRLIALALSFAVSTLAYRVSSPNPSKGWTNSGAQGLTWERVDTDRLNFTAVLTNQDRNVMPNNNQVLAALVDGTLLSIGVNPPAGGWPVGRAFRVNLVQDTDHLDTILAQSSEFDILASTSSSSTPRSATGTTVIAPTTTNAITSSDATATGASNPPGTSDALPVAIVQNGLLFTFALLSLVMA